MGFVVALRLDRARRPRAASDSFDNALADTLSGYYKAELFRAGTRETTLEGRRGRRARHLGWIH